MSEQRIGDWIETFTGRKFWPLDPRPEEVDLDDIAHSLSMLCRYNGHVSRFYSVAEHSVLVSKAVYLAGGGAGLQLAGLLHDAAEAYISDVPRPTKPALVGLKEIESAIETAITAHFGVLINSRNDLIHEMDSRILWNERAELMSTAGHEWALHAGGTIPGIEIVGWTPLQAETAFRERFGVLSRALGLRP